MRVDGEGVDFADAGVVDGEAGVGGAEAAVGAVGVVPEAVLTETGSQPKKAGCPFPHGYGATSFSTKSRNSARSRPSPFSGEDASQRR